MQTYLVNFYLANGGTATVTFENISNIGEVLQGIKTQLAQADNDFFISQSTSVIYLQKDKIIGYSIDLK